MRRDLLREDTPSPAGDESSSDPVLVVGEPPPARRHSSLEELFRAPPDDDSSREEGLLDVGRDAAGREARARERTLGQTTRRTRPHHASPRVPEVVVSYESDPGDGGRRHARTRVLEQDGDNDHDGDFSRGGASHLGSHWNDRGNFYFEKQRRKCLVPSLVATGRDAGRSMVKVRGRGWLKLLGHDAFTSLIEMHWFFLVTLVVGLHFATFLLFALFWLIVKQSSKSCLGGFDNGGFNAALIFSVATQTTLGYGTRFVKSECRAGAALLFAQIIVGVFVNALSLGVIFARITDPKHRARSIFVSDAACIATRDGELKFMFRVADARDRKVISPAVRACLYSWSGRTTSEGERLPVSAQPLRISKLDPLMLLPITIEHVIDETSPLFGHTHDSLRACGAEIVVAFEGCVDATGLSFSARQSYLPSEILWGHTFRRVIRRAPSGSTRHEVALARFHELEPQEMLESPEVLKRRGVSFQLGGRALLTAQQMCEATIEAARGGGKNVTPFPAIGANTLALSDSIVIDEAMTTATFRVGDTRSPWGCQFADVVARAFLHVWFAKSDGATTHECFELPLSRRGGGRPSAEGGASLDLWAPALVDHDMTAVESPSLENKTSSRDVDPESRTPNAKETSPLLRAFSMDAERRNVSLRLSARDAVVVVCVSGTCAVDGTPRTRRRCYRAGDILPRRRFVEITSPPSRRALWTEPRVDFDAFHDTVAVETERFD